MPSISDETLMASVNSVNKCIVGYYLNLFDILQMNGYVDPFLGVFNILKLILLFAAGY